MYNRMPSSELVANRYVPAVKVTTRVHRAENSTPGTLHDALGLPWFPQSKLSPAAPSSRTITAVPANAMLLKYSPFQWSAATVAKQPATLSCCQLTAADVPPKAW